MDSGKKGSDKKTGAASKDVINKLKRKLEETQAKQGSTSKADHDKTGGAMESSEISKKKADLEEKIDRFGQMKSELNDEMDWGKKVELLKEMEKLAKEIKDQTHVVALLEAAEGKFH